MDSIRSLARSCSSSATTSQQHTALAASSADDGPQWLLKASSSVAGPSAGIELRLPGRRVDHEIELRRRDRDRSPHPVRVPTATARLVNELLAELGRPPLIRKGRFEGWGA